MEDKDLMYQDRIREICDPYDPRHVEAYVRLEHSTLDGLSAEQFADEVRTGITCVDEDGAENAERLAQSFGL